MAANKFATMLQRNTHKLTVILVYAVLEWILIILLLLNSFFTYLITKFANYFGLKPPCPWCSRVDHVLETQNNPNSYRDLVCETHATEISKLGYCSNHRKLAESQYMCADCSGSMPNRNDGSNTGMTRRIAFISWVSNNRLENGEKILKCSCCNENLSSSIYPPYLLFKPSWGAFKYTQKGSLIIEALDDDKNGGGCKELSKLGGLAFYIEDINAERNDEEVVVDEHEHQILSDVGSFGLKDGAEEECSMSESNLQSDEKEENGDQKAEIPSVIEKDFDGTGSVHQSFDDSINRCFEDDDSLVIINPQFNRNVEQEFNRLYPVELIDLSTAAKLGSCNLKAEDHVGKQDHQCENSDSTLQIKLFGVDAVLFKDKHGKKTGDAEVETMEMHMQEGDKSEVLNLEEMNKDLISEACQEVISFQEDQTSSIKGNNVEVAETKEPDELPAEDEEANDFQFFMDQTESKITTEVPQPQESTSYSLSSQQVHPSTRGNGAEIPDSLETYMACNELDTNNSEETTSEGKMVSACKDQEGVNNHSSMHSDPNEAEEEKFPETPTSVDSAHYLHKKLQMFEKRDSGAEESLDGSVISEMDAGDPVVTVERLKTALKSERKALNALYAELEEERSASAIAANQTMAMINRLQEEKAAMQMEALQYQRMMEEQSEYDQEALQLLNELMMKREKEKQELEKELEVCRKKVLEYESKERMRMVRRMKNGSVRSRNSSATCSIAEDVDELSIDLNREAKDEESSISLDQESGHNNTPDDDVQNLTELALDCVKQMSALDDPLAEFEDERLSILDQLKALEDKLISLGASEYTGDDDNVKEFDGSYEMSTPEVNGFPNGSSKDKRYPDRKSIGSMAKNLLPLLDAADNEVEDGMTCEENMESKFIEMENYSVPKFELDIKKLAIEEEVDHVYERLQALEADREFLKHCMSSIKKGDKGINLLQEILQHLRDLRDVELCVRNMGDHPLG